MKQIFEELKSKPLQDGEACSHIGCLSHVTHPCENCGRIASNMLKERKLERKLLKEIENMSDEDYQYFDLLWHTLAIKRKINEYKTNKNFR